MEGFWEMDENISICVLKLFLLVKWNMWFKQLNLADREVSWYIRRGFQITEWVDKQLTENPKESMDIQEIGALETSKWQDQLNAEGEWKEVK